ncbi:MAG TPA: hypothetical protein VFC29_25960 [Candidatus Limnocylindrales bacterium]|nr:hypothetical protein [Candidatus Limnocylindrales bacterium]
MAAEQKIMQPVVRIVREGTFFVHCYLACGHMVTVQNEDVSESPPSSMECWACEASKKERPSK